MQVELQGVGKTFGIKSISLQIASGQLVALVGTNGAGKSTLLRCIASLYQPTVGRILLNDEPFDRRNIELHKRLHYVSDSPPVVENQTILGHIAEYFAAYEHSPHNYQQRVLELLDEFDLSEQRYYPLSHLSRGQRYKASLVIQIALDRELWLCDEPFASGIDGVGMERFKQHARAASQRGRTIIYTTQILEIAESFSDQICILHKGELAHSLTTSDLELVSEKQPGLLEILQELS